MTILVEELTRVIELARMAAKARGINRREGLFFVRRARLIVIGIKKAVAAVLLRKALIAAAAIMMTVKSCSGLPVECLSKAWPVISITPVLDSPAVMIRMPRIIMLVLLPKPAKAVSGGSSLVRITAISTVRATTSTGKYSMENRTTARTMIPSRRAMGSVMIRLYGF